MMLLVMLMKFLTVVLNLLAKIAAMNRHG
jgi:hypothetical protein